jgi:hypothetical protein
MHLDHSTVLHACMCWRHMRTADVLGYWLRDCLRTTLNTVHASTVFYHGPERLNELNPWPNSASIQVRLLQSRLGPIHQLVHAICD